MSVSRTNQNFENELTAQVSFLEQYLPMVDQSLKVDDVQNDYNDGVINGNILEFKLIINNLNAVLFQTIKYLSVRRIKGKPVPANIILLSANEEKAYLYHSSDYLKDIETVYVGAASKGNGSFSAKQYVEQIDYSTMKGQERMIWLLRSKEYIKIHIDENCIVGWANRFYEDNKSATKAEFIGDETGKTRIVGEIRNPTKLRDYIYPYEGKSNKKFRYLMDKLNDDLHKKDLGAFYTDPMYAEKSLELVREAISKVPEGNDFIILDRCAGTGNLEQFMTDEELSHVIVSTYEYYEYKVLMENFSDKVRSIIPPVESNNTFLGGMVRGANALEKDYVENEIIMQYVNNQKCTIIVFENPPYSESTSAEHQRKGHGKKSSEWKKSYVAQEMKKYVKGKGLNDMGNAFIWSAFHYYLRQPTDCLIVYSPVKYWKAQGLIAKRFVRGFAFNRRHFHTNIGATIMVAYWTNEDQPELDNFTIQAIDISEKKVDGKVKRELVDCGMLAVRKLHNTYSEVYYDKRKMDDEYKVGILCGLNGKEKTSKITNKPLTHPDVIGYMVAHSSGFDNPDLDSSLLVAGRYDGHGFYLFKDNFLEKMPMFAATRFYKYNREWTNRGRIMKSGDGSERFFHDLQVGKLNGYLLKCLLFAILEPQNHMREFIGSDGKHYKNQLCLDTTNGETLASVALKTMVMNEEEKALIALLEKIMVEAKATKNYQPSVNYGLFQIKDELDTFYIVQNNRKNKKIFEYKDLHGDIETLSKLVKSYYSKEIEPKLFEYEFLK